ncbi:MAG: ribonuclease R [Dethiobacteria bacterium]
MKPKEKKKSLPELQDRIMQLLSGHRQRSLTLQQLSGALGLRKEERTTLLEQLQLMQADGLLVKTERGRYGLPRRLNCITGVLEGNRRGYAFLRPDSKKEEDVFIKPGRLNGAVHGDRVLVRLLSSGGGRRSREGEVVTILSRGSERLLGTLERRGKKYYVVPDDRRLGRAVNLSHGLKGARRGEKVMVKVDSWQKGNQPPRGHLVERIGMPGVPHTEQLLFDRRHELPGEFPPQVLKELDSLPPAEAIGLIASEEKRVDLRNLFMVTIDGEEAKDFDDAVSLEMLPEGGFRLGVHIADVSHYVREGKAIDREALKRGTSTYLVDRAVHMLPPLLSENLCSLKAGEDRLAVSVLIDLSATGELQQYRFFPALVRVARRLTYPQVEAYLAGGVAPAGDQSFPGEILGQMDRLAAQLRQRRLQRGVLDLDIPEPQFVLDDAGKVLRVERRQLGRSESLIEEFMILANEVIAAHFAREQLPLIYRVHAVPAEEKLTALRETLLLLGDPTAAELRRFKPHHLKMLLERSRGRVTENLIRNLVLRSLPQARYTTVNEGHFGLASRCYCHFTAPIRRYPDLVVHRLLKESLEPGGFSEGRLIMLQSRLPAIAEHVSERERAAMEAERASEDLKKAEYMENKLGEVFPGIINGVTNFGLFVELENTVEGMIPLSELTDDYYVYQERSAAVVGERTRKTYRLGDPIRIKVIRVDSAAGKITFTLDQG